MKRMKYDALKKQKLEEEKQVIPHGFDTSSDLCCGGCGTHFCMSCGECEKPLGCTLLYDATPLHTPHPHTKQYRRDMQLRKKP